MLQRAVLTAAIIASVAAVPALSAQTAPPPASTSDPIARALFEPELIMKHRRAINLTDDQRDVITRLIRELQAQVMKLQWDLQDETEALATELGRSRVDLDRAMDRLGKVMQNERKIKEAHLTLLVRIKNTLRPDQQEMLKKLKEQP
jgi:Spy/CpxP family protein refolding chaperone